MLDNSKNNIYNDVNANGNVNNNNPNMSNRVTIIDVAREAGVSLMTVSRVVNNKEDVSASTRQKVLGVIQELGYRPSSIARGLVTHRTGTLGIVVPDIDNPFFSGVVRGAENQAYAEGYSVFLCNTNEEQKREIAVLETLEEKQVDGLLLCSSRLDDEELCRMVSHYSGVVLISRYLEENGIGTVLIDDQSGGEIAAQHLISRGHKAIGLISGPPISYSSQYRTKGYRSSLQEHGLPFNPEWVRHCSPVVDEGYREAIDLLRKNPNLTALICHNDLVAVGAIQACIELGINVPDDIAIVGYDDIPMASLVTPALTTLHVPRCEMGAKAMCLLLSKVADCEMEENKIFIQPNLIIRESAP
jgi:LacI family transcriptional regulator